MRHAGRRSVAILYSATPSGPRRCSFPAHMSTRPAVIVPRSARTGRPRQAPPRAAPRPAAPPAQSGAVARKAAARWLTAVGIALVGVALAGRVAAPHTLIVPVGGNPAVAAAAGCHAAGDSLSGLVTQPARGGGIEVLYFCEAG